MVNTGNVIFLAAMALLPLTASAGDAYDKKYSGDGTVYGKLATGSGNCAIKSPLPSMYSGMIPVALNK